MMRVIDNKRRYIHEYHREFNKANIDYLEALLSYSKTNDATKEFNIDDTLKMLESIYKKYPEFKYDNSCLNNYKREVTEKELLTYMNKIEEVVNKYSNLDETYDYITKYEKEKVKTYMYMLEMYLRHHSYRYHELDDPIIDDLEFDKKYQRLKELSEEYPEFKREYSIIDTIGYNPIWKEDIKIALAVKQAEVFI